MSTPLVAQLDQFDDAWADNIPERAASFWRGLRRNAAIRARAILAELDPDNVDLLLQKLRIFSNGAFNYRGQMCSEETNLRYQLLFYAVVHRCLELEPLSREEMERIAKEEACPEIKTFLAGGTIR